jgi:hypothetical protein
VRLDPGLVDRLDEQSRHAGQTRTQLTKTLLEEGLRMAAHPGIVFRSGPAGRRPGLAGGQDIWEIARLFQARKPVTRTVMDEIANELRLTIWQVEAALGYYAEFQDEIDQWIDLNDVEAERAETAFHRRQALLKG